MLATLRGRSLAQALQDPIQDLVVELVDKHLAQGSNRAFELIQLAIHTFLVLALLDARLEGRNPVAVLGALLDAHAILGFAVLDFKLLELVFGCLQVAILGLASALSGQG